MTAQWLHERYGSPLPPAESKTPEPIPPFFLVLSEEQAHTHKLLATLRSTFEGAGWTGPVAVARIRRGRESQLVYVTADAVSLFPRGTALPEGVSPLHEIVPTEISRSMMGSLSVTDKIKLVTRAGWEVGQVVTTHGVAGATTDVQDDDQYQVITETDSLLPAVVSRGIPDADMSSVMALFALASVGQGIKPGDPHVGAAMLRTLRWAVGQPSEYVSMYQQLMVSEAVAAMDDLDWADAEYALQKALSFSQSQQQEVSA